MKPFFLRNLSFILFFKPLVWIFLGLEVKYRERLPLKGPAILVANHNSHLDTVVLMSLYPIRLLHQIRPVAAAEYFLKSSLISWFSRKILHIIPIERFLTKRKAHDPLQKVVEAIHAEAIVIFYPEGTRGLPEQMGKFKKGIAHLAKLYPEIPIVPIYLQGLGKILPKGKMLLVPYNAKVVIGEPLLSVGNRSDFLVFLQEKISQLAKEL